MDNETLCLYLVLLTLASGLMLLIMHHRQCRRDKEFFNNFVKTYLESLDKK